MSSTLPLMSKDYLEVVYGLLVSKMVTYLALIIIFCEMWNVNCAKNIYHFVNGFHRLLKHSDWPQTES